MIAIGLGSLVSCGYPEAVVFSDKSTAAIADRTGWTITASSEELSGEGEVNGRAAAVLDGDINTFWHSQWEGAEPPYPHWLLVDMKKPLKVISVDLTARQNNGNGMTKFMLEGSTDGNSWTKLGEFTFVPATKSSQSYPVSSASPYQFIKLTMLEGLINSTHLAEFEVFTVKE